MRFFGNRFIRTGKELRLGTEMAQVALFACAMAEFSGSCRALPPERIAKTRAPLLDRLTRIVLRIGTEARVSYTAIDDMTARFASVADKMVRMDRTFADLCDYVESLLPIVANVDRGRGRFHGAALVAPLLVLPLAACQTLQTPPRTSPLGPELDVSIRALAALGENEGTRSKAAADYRRLVVEHLPQLLRDAAERPLVTFGPKAEGIESPRSFTDIEPVARPRTTHPALHRLGLGLPLIGRIASNDPNAPSAGYRVPITLVALPKGSTGDCCEVVLVDPGRVQTVHTAHGDLPLAKDLETPLAATRVTGPRPGAGIANLLRPGCFTGVAPASSFCSPSTPTRCRSSWSMA